MTLDDKEPLPMQPTPSIEANRAAKYRNDPPEIDSGKNLRYGGAVLEPDVVGKAETLDNQRRAGGANILKQKETTGSTFELTGVAGADRTDTRDGMKK